MSRRGKSRADALRVKRAKRQADARNETDGAVKKQKNQDQLDDHEVVETLSLSGKASEPVRYRYKWKWKTVHFDNLFKDIQLDYIAPEIQPLRCCDEGLAVHLPQPIQEKILNHQYINLALLLKGSLELSEICSGSTLHIMKKVV